MAHRDSTVERRETLFREAVAIIERDYRRQIDLNTVAAQIATSRRQLQRAFAEIGGTTFRTYLAQVRCSGHSSSCGKARCRCDRWPTAWATASRRSSRRRSGAIM